MEILTSKTEVREKLKKNDNELSNNIDTLKNQILYNNQSNEI